MFNSSFGGNQKTQPQLDDSELWPENIRNNVSILSNEEKTLVQLLLSNQQHHLFDNWDLPGINDELKHAFFNQVLKLHESYPSPNGLSDYVKNARYLLASSKNGDNPLDGYYPEVPNGIVLEPLTEKYLEYEKLGLTEIGKCGFVLVAGGLGERLGYSGIKIELPSETTTNTCYLELYCQNILAIQSRYSKSKIRIPLAIMVSDDTYTKTLNLLESKQNFGLHPDQLTIMKQEKVAALTDDLAHISLSSKYEIESKPHGHGDVHSLMYSTGTAQKWLDGGIKYLYFFQDTNGNFRNV